MRIMHDFEPFRCIQTLLLLGYPSSVSEAVIIFPSRKRRRVIGSLIFFACASKRREREERGTNDSSLGGSHMLRASIHRGEGDMDRGGAV